MLAFGSAGAQLKQLGLEPCVGLPLWRLNNAGKVTYCKRQGRHKKGSHSRTWLTFISHVRKMGYRESANSWFGLHPEWALETPAGGNLT